MGTINLGIQIVPKSTTMDSYKLVDEAIAVIAASGVKYEVNPFETVMEGPEEQLMAVAKKAQQAVIDAGGEEILVYYRMQIRPGQDVRMEEKTGPHR
ncbi:MTH1187 family thiamine-binding protein [Cyclobacterium xiamenense]|uniref:thiamine-binding protein n=1 Tax=Cyclobacterium xiamenense TaxID=1297121 RepID=UPI0035CF5099